jgi:uncharacterized protein
MRILHHIRIALVAALATLTVAAAASAQSGPALSGRVVDQAGILDQSTRAALTAKLAALEARNSDQLVVATVSSLQGQAIEPYATGLFRAWRLGQKNKDNGVLLLVAPNEHKVRIEVGYGLEGTLTDAVARLIIEQSVLPRFRANDFPGGIVRATDDIIQVLTGDAAQWQRRAAAAPQDGFVITRGDGTVVSGWEKTFVLAVALLMCLMAVSLVGFALLAMLAGLLVRIGLLPREKDRRGAWLWLNHFNRDPPPERRLAHARHSGRSSSSWSSSDSWSSSSSSSSSSDSFSGGGGSSGGGGASGSW